VDEGIAPTEPMALLLLRLSPEQGIINVVQQDVDLNRAQNQGISRRCELFNE
jgi:hypothetical protein